MEEVTNVLACAIDKMKDYLPDLYQDTMYQLKEIAYTISPDEAQRIVRSMRPRGQRWDYDTVRTFVESKGIHKDMCKYYLCMNMAYNDYYQTAELVGRSNDPEFYFSIARDFIDDADGKEFKVERYFLDQ